MNDFNQSSNQTGEGFEEYKDMPISLASFISQKMAMKQSAAVEKEVPAFDPHKMMVNKFKMEKGEEVEPIEAVKWPEKEVKALEDFCKQHGILGFNCGRMSPLAALAMLKSKLGIIDAPLEERVPYGYQKMGGEKTVLHG